MGHLRAQFEPQINGFKDKALSMLGMEEFEPQAACAKLQSKLLAGLEAHVITNGFRDALVSKG